MGNILKHINDKTATLTINRTSPLNRSKVIFSLSKEKTSTLLIFTDMDIEVIKNGS